MQSNIFEKKTSDLFLDIDPNLRRHLEDFIQNEIEKALTKKEHDGALKKSNQLDLEDSSQLMRSSSTSGHKSKRPNPLTGMYTKPTQTGELESDIFSVMMLSKLGSPSWLVGLFSCTIQITLGSLIIIDQVQKDFFGTTLSIPIKGDGHLRIVQVLAILLSIMTQMDILMGIRTMLIFPFHEKRKWCQLIGSENAGLHLWLTHIFLPNFLKSLQGGLILVASFVVIIQSDSVVDVLKDYSALFVVSTVANLFFDLAGLGYFGSTLSKKVQEVKEAEFEEDDEKIRFNLVSSFFSLIFIFLGAWIYVTIGQVNGRYVKQEYPLCDTEKELNSTTNITNLQIIGDGICQSGKGVGTNIVECGWDGGDCIKLNQRYPKCFAEDFSLLGDGECNELSSYNNKDCGFDNGDCIEANEKKQLEYPSCSVINIAWVGDKVCNGRDYYTPECNFDGGDCDNCNVKNMRLVGDGICNQGEYNTEECSYDGGDCDAFNAAKKQTLGDCLVPNIGWIGDGVCNGQEYASDACGNDGSDCDNCFVDDIMLIGNGFCNGGDYMAEGCTFDGGDCTECIVEDPALVGNGVCDGGKYNTEGCDYDGGDCIKNNTDLHEKYKECFVENPWYIGDNFCHGGEYYTEECGFDGGDCANCVVDDMSLFSDGVCHGREYNTIECGYDGGDCAERNGFVENEFPLCAAEFRGWTGDGICDGSKYATPACGNDGGDCQGCEVDDMTLISDGFCDEGAYNVEGCSFDGLDCFPSITLLGDSFPGIAKYSAGVLGSDGFMYGIPNYADKMFKFDPVSKNTTLISDDLGMDEWKWIGGVVGNNDMIYGVPCNARNILSFDLNSQKTMLIADGHPLLEADNKFFGGATAKNGQIYFIPLNHNKVVKFDPSNNDNPLTEIGDDLGFLEAKAWGGVLGEDGNIYSMPCYSTRVLKITVENDTTSFIGDEYEGLWKWVKGVLAKDGNIYACPLSFNRILQINVKNQTTALVGPDFGDILTKWSGFVEGADGFLYGIPARSDNLLRFDPVSHAATLIPLDDNLVGGDWKWIPGMLAANGFIYAIPTHKPRVLSIAPLTFRP